VRRPLLARTRYDHLLAATVSQCGPLARGSQVPLPLPNLYPSGFEIRTPEAPGVDPNCDPLCPGKGYVYGVGFLVSNQNPFPNGTIVKVSPPWVIVYGSSNTSFSCDYTVTNCAEFLTGNTGPVYIMTKDPNAPARNATFEYLTGKCP
jgi:hypothetical protein